MHNPKSSFSDFVLFPVLLFTVISFTLPVAYNSIAVILLFALYLADYRNIKKNLVRYFSERKNILLLVIFCCLLLSLLYSDDKKYGLKAVLTALPLVSLPIALTGIHALSEKKVFTLKRVFVIACFVSSLIYLLLAIQRSGMLDGSYKLVHAPENFYAYFVSQLTYNHLSPSIHAIFYSLYIALAILLILFEFEKRSGRQKFMYGALVGYFLVYLLLLTSITVNFALYSFLILNLYLRFSFRKWWHFLVFFGSIIIGTATTIYVITIKYLGPHGDGTYRFDSLSLNEKIWWAFAAALLVGAIAILIKLFFRERYLYVLSVAFIAAVASFLGYISVNNNDPNNLKQNNISVRVKYGEAAIQTIKAHPLFGIGIGDKKNELIMKTGLPPGAAPEHVFNSHNQFLDFWLAAGIIPAICFALFLINEFKKAFLQQHIVYIGLVYCFCLFCFTDSAMMVQRGLVFFLFFIWLLDFDGRSKKAR